MVRFQRAPRLNDEKSMSTKYLPANIPQLFQQTKFSCLNPESFPNTQGMQCLPTAFASLMDFSTLLHNHFFGTEDRIGYGPPYSKVPACRQSCRPNVYQQLLCSLIVSSIDASTAHQSLTAACATMPAAGNVGSPLCLLLSLTLLCAQGFSTSIHCTLSPQCEFIHYLNSSSILCSRVNVL